MLLKQQIKVESEFSIVMPTEVIISEELITTDALLDTGAEVNIISQHFVIEHQLTPMNGLLLQLQLLNRQRVYCYEAHCVKYWLKDT